MILLIDIDGTLADFSQRAHGAGPEPDRAYPEDHAKWVTAVQDDERLLSDPAIPGMLWLVSRLSKQAKVVYCTARHEQHAQVTMRWLKGHMFPNGALVMRKDGDMRQTSDYKESVIRELQKEKKGQMIIALDDAPMPEMALIYRALGVLHLQPTWCRYTEDGEENALYSTK